MGIIKETRDTSLAICLLAWNRGELLRPCIDSLMQQLAGLRASIWIIDNGSGPATKRIIDGLAVDPPHQLFKVHLPENMGIPYAINIFNDLIARESDFAGLRAPDVVMVADADAYFKLPVQQLVSILQKDETIGVVSGHSSVEHPPLSRSTVTVGTASIDIEDKEVERGLCLVMRRCDLDLCCPFPHDIQMDFDWELMSRIRSSIESQGERIVAVNHVAHLGLYESTWSPHGVPTSSEEMAEVDQILESLGLMSERRRELRQRFLELRPDETSLRSASLQSQPTLPQTGVGGGPAGDVAPAGVLVLGMHRSGTSVVTRLLHEMGGHIGTAEQLLAPDDRNPSGYWERTDVVVLNQRLLARFNADAYRIGDFEPSFLETTDCSDLDTWVQPIVEELAGSRPWVLKDPRLCLTLPYWKTRLGTPVVVHVVRDPLEVIASLHARDGLSSAYGLALWEKYNVTALEQGRGLARILVSYNDLLENPAATVERLHRGLLDLGLTGLRIPGPEVLSEVVDGGLRHHASSRAQESQYLNLAQHQLLSAFRDGTCFQADARFQLSVAARDVLTRYPESIDLEQVLALIESEQSDRASAS